MVGLLVHGDNHFAVRGPEPDDSSARLLIRHWSVISIGQTTPDSLRAWRISTKEFRENLQWAVIVGANEGEHSPAVVQLLSEIASRGIVIRRI